MPEHIADDWQICTNGVICGYWRAGDQDSPVLHLLHGNGFCGMTLLALAESLPRSWNLLVSDVPGHGRSSAAQSVFPVWSELADAVASFAAGVIAERMPTAKIKNTTLNNGAVNTPGDIGNNVYAIGHSMGGVLTTMMAARYRGLFSRIVLLDPVLFPASLIRLQHVLKFTRLWGINPLVKQARRRQAHWADRASAGRYFRSKRLYANWDERALGGYLEYGLREVDTGVALACAPEWEARLFGSAPDGMWDCVRTLDVPVTILKANGEFGFVEPGVKRAIKINPNVRAIDFGGSHCFPMEEPERTADVIVKIFE